MAILVYRRVLHLYRLYFFTFTWQHLVQPSQMVNSFLSFYHFSCLHTPPEVRLCFLRFSFSPLYLRCASKDRNHEGKDSLTGLPHPLCHLDGFHSQKTRKPQNCPIFSMLTGSNIPTRNEKPSKGVTKGEGSFLFTN